MITTLTPDQEFVISSAVHWFHHSPEQLFQYDGPPGSGKSVVLNEIVRRLGLRLEDEVAPMSFIGAASLVMRTKGLYTARTAHSWLFDLYKEDLRSGAGTGEVLKTHSGKRVSKWGFVPKTALSPTIKLIIVDEAYCMPRSLRPIIESFGIKILACGDSNQLPPVNDIPAFLVDGKIYHLTQIMRQTGKDDIIFLANQAAMGYPLMNGYYGNSLVIDRQDLTDDMLLWADVIICGTNKTRDILNNHIRSIRGFHSVIPRFGERIVCRNNNWQIRARDANGIEINLVNGLIGSVVNCPSISNYDTKVKGLNIQFQCDTANVVFDCIADGLYFIGDSAYRAGYKSGVISPYYRAQLFEFAYAITCHISQGSQFPKVIYIEERVNPSIQRCLNLVGITRATDQLIYVNDNNRPWREYPEDFDPTPYFDKYKDKLNYFNQLYSQAKQKIDREKYKDQRVSFNKFKRRRHSK